MNIIFKQENVLWDEWREEDPNPYSHMTELSEVGLEGIFPLLFHLYLVDLLGNYFKLLMDCICILN